MLRAELKKRKIKWWTVCSRGIKADEGSKISANSAAVLKEIGIDSTGFVSKQLNQNIISQSALVITMTTEQKQLLEGCGNVCSIKDICGFDVPDPYGGGVEIYRITRDSLKIACEKIINDYILKYEERI